MRIKNEILAANQKKSSEQAQTYYSHTTICGSIGVQLTLVVSMYSEIVHLTQRRPSDLAKV